MRSTKKDLEEKNTNLLEENRSLQVDLRRERDERKAISESVRRAQVELEHVHERHRSELFEIIRWLANKDTAQDPFGKFRAQKGDAEPKCPPFPLGLL